MCVCACVCVCVCVRERESVSDCKEHSITVQSSEPEAYMVGSAGL